MFRKRTLYQLGEIAVKLNIVACSQKSQQYHDFLFAFTRLTVI